MINSIENMLSTAKFMIQQFPKLLTGSILLSSLCISYFGLLNIISFTFYYFTIFVACVVVYALWTAIIRIRRPPKTDFFSNSHFFQTKVQGRPFRQFPLASKTGWTSWTDNRRNEIVPNRTEYMPTLELQSTVDDIIALVCKDFLNSWFQTISSDAIWLAKMELLIHHLMAQLVHRAKAVDLVALILSRIFPIIARHIQDFKKAESLVRGGSKKAPSEHIQDEILLAKHYRQGNLHPALKGSIEVTKEQECAHLRDMAKKILHFILPKAEASSRLASTLLREVFSCALLQPLVEAFSDPDFCNQTFDSAIDSLSKELDEEYNPFNQRSFKQMDGFESHDRQKPPSFEDFISEIRECKNIGDAVQIKEKLLIEIDIKKDILGISMVILGAYGSDVENKAYNYVKQLEYCLSLVEERILVINSRIEKMLKQSSTEFPALLMSPEGFSSFMDFLALEERHYVLLFWKAIKDLPSVPKDLLVTSSEEIPPFATSMLKIWQEYLSPNSEYLITDLVELSAESLTGFTGMCLQFGNQESERENLITNNGFAYLTQLKDQAYGEMLADDYPRYLISPVNSMNKSQLGTDIQLDFDIDSGEESASPRKKIGKAIIDSVFRRRSMRSFKRTSMDDDEREDNEFVNKLFTTPKRVAKSENVQVEINSLLADENMFGGTTAKSASFDEPDVRRYNDDQISPEDGKMSILSHIRRKTKGELMGLKTKATSFFGPQKSIQMDLKPDGITVNNVLKDVGSNIVLTPEINVTSDATHELSLNSEITSSSQKDHSIFYEFPSIVTPPQKAVDLGIAISKMKDELNSINTKITSSSKANSTDSSIKQLQYMMRGMCFELDDLVKEKRMVEFEELNSIITTVLNKLTVGSCYCKNWGKSGGY